MSGSNSFNNSHGQTLILAIVLVSICSTMLLGLFRVSLAAQEKIRLQISADMTILSVLNYQAKSLNNIALANRAILSNDALAGQINAMVSEITFYRRLADKFQKLMQFIPYLGAINRFLSMGIHAMERTIKGIASLTLPITRFSNTGLKQIQKTIRYILPGISLHTARSALKKNMPRARLTPPSEAVILRQARSLQKNIVKIKTNTVNQLKLKTMDDRTLKRNWRIRVAGASPIKKTGGTIISSKDLVAQDKLRMKVFRRLRWKWKTVLSTRSRTSDFGYTTPAELFSLDVNNTRSSLSFPVLVQAEMPSSIANDSGDKKKLFALSAGKLVYDRDTRQDESSNLFNPFWKAQLIPVASEPTATRIVPTKILKEVRH